jgi:hypothetical protein
MLAPTTHNCTQQVQTHRWNQVIDNKLQFIGTINQFNLFCTNL